jgi:acetyl esterase/lipase
MTLQSASLWRGRTGPGRALARRALRRAALAVGAAALALAAAPVGAIAQPPPQLNVPYGTDPKQVMDIYPAEPANAPMVVLVHGGGWTNNDKKEENLESKYLQSFGFAVFNINYRLDTKKVQAFPKEVEDVEAATAFAIAHAAEFNGNTAKLVMLGGSSGGQLVGSASQHLNEASAGTVKAVITLSGPFDFPVLLQEIRENKIEPHLAKNIPQALGCVLETTCKTPAKEAWAVQWSPDQQVTSANCPAAWLVVNAEHELMPIGEANMMTSALESHSCVVTKKILPGNQHSFFYWNAIKETVVKFIKAL